MMDMHKDTKGFTLIEVVMAMVIIGVVVIGAFVLANRAFNIGQSSRERTQAAQLAQEQAEALRSLRDTSSSWDAFRSSINASFATSPVDPASPSTCRNVDVVGLEGEFFHVERTSGGNAWQPQPYSFCPSVNDVNFYEVVIAGQFTGRDGDEDKLEAVVRVQWPQIGGGPDQVSEVTVRLSRLEFVAVPNFISEPPQGTPTPTFSPTPPTNPTPSPTVSQPPCTRKPAGEAIVVKFRDPPPSDDNDRVGQLWSTYNRHVYEWPANVPPGRYDIELVGFEWRYLGFNFQPQEQYFITGFNAGGSEVLSPTRATEDLIDNDPDGNGYEQVTTQVGDCIDVGSTITRIKTHHVHPCPNPADWSRCNADSIRPVRAIFYPVF